MTAADDAAVTQTVQDFVTTGMDLASVYFVLRNAKVAKPAPKAATAAPATSAALPPASPYSAAIGK